MKKILIMTTFVMFGCLSLAIAQNQGLTATAEIKGTSPDSPITGTVKFTETAEGLLVEAQVQNVPNPGEHGFHIHEVGNCGDMGKTAGGHFNPEKVEHGLLPKDGHKKAHAGDMGNILITERGFGLLTVTLPHVGLENGHFNVAGLSVILHEKADDFGQPVGNAGGRIACGIIEVKK